MSLVGNQVSDVFFNSQFHSKEKLDMYIQTKQVSTVNADVKQHENFSGSEIVQVITEAIMSE